MRTVYVDNAATTQTSKIVIDGMIPYMNEIYGNPSSLHSVGQVAKEALENARAKVAKCLNADPSEIYFTSGGSESDNQAILSAAEKGIKSGKTHIISTRVEHHAVLHTLNKLKKKGFDVELLDVSSEGLVTPEQVEKAIRDDTCLVTIMYANNEIGTIMPIKEIGEICRKKNVTFHTDAVQAVGHLNIDVKDQNIDMLSLSAHKFHGPKGVGALFVKKGIYLSSLIEGGAQEKNRRAGTENIPGIVGLSIAIEDACNHLEENSHRMTILRDKLIAGLIIIPSCFAFGLKPDAGPGLIFATLPNVFAQMPAGRICGAAFFLFMSFAALSTLVAVFENIDRKSVV